MSKSFKHAKIPAVFKYVYLSLLLILSFTIIFLSGCIITNANISSPSRKLNKINDSKQAQHNFFAVKNLNGKIPGKISVKGFGAETNAENPCSNATGYLFNNIIEKTDKYDDYITSENDSEAYKNFDQVTEDFAQDSTLHCPSGTEPAAAVNIQAALAEIINAARNDAAVPALIINESLNNIAQQRSDDMAARGYFSHITPEGKSVYNYLFENGIMYSTAGENIQFCSPPSMASPGLFFNTWMNSDVHRANMLNPYFTGAGIGASSNGESYYIVLIFTG